MINLCTLFDSRYLDKGLALYYSLERTTSDFSLYVLCFDEKSHEILKDINLKNMTVVSLEEFETDELKAVKETRSSAEYCWTCTAASIEYMIDRFGLDSCTYIDADLYFYSDASSLFIEIEESGCDVAIMEHRFGHKKNGEEITNKSGKYCVEFNYFKNNSNGRKVLAWWKKECLNWCYAFFDSGKNYEFERYGDQKYLEQFAVRFDNIYVIRNLGAGVAPWNLFQYKIHSNKDSIILYHNDSKQYVELCFFHFQNLKYISNDFVNINSQTKDVLLKTIIYRPYLYEIEAQRTMLLKQYGIHFAVKKSYSSNPIKAFIQKNIMPFRIKSFSDIVNLKEVR